MIDTNILLVLVAVFSIWLLILSYNQYKIIVKNKELFKGKEKGNIYELINNYLLKMRTIEKDNDTVLKELEKVVRTYESCFQKLGIVRYNPFGNIGGDQSFSFALLDKSDDGVVVTSIHNRDGNRVYAKPINKGKSEHHLSKEEDEALSIANKK